MRTENAAVLFFMTVIAGVSYGKEQQSRGKDVRRATPMIVSTGVNNNDKYSL